MFWGLSEAQDLLHTYQKYNKDSTGQGVRQLNVLLLGSGDIRHILQTLANQRTESQECPLQLSFHIVDGCVEVVARNLLLLDIVLSQDTSMSLLGRTHLFMDIYGNSFMRPISRDYQMKRGKFLIDLITSAQDEIPDKYTPLVDVSGLKYRERDQLLDVFSLWRSDQQVNFKAQWDNQLRKYLAQRYDSRRGAFDWDLHMELRYRGGERICNQEYFDFRETGIAFQFPEFEYPFENRSLVVLQRDQRHRKTYHLMTDMHTGPYPSFGLHCDDDDEMTKSSHGDNFYRATDITERNLLKILHNIRLRERPSNEELRKHKLGTAKFSPGNMFTGQANGEEADKYSDSGRWIELDHVKFHFLSPGIIKNLAKQVQFKGFFDVAFIGAGCFQYLNDSFTDCLNKDGLVLFELLQLSLLDKDKRSAFEARTKEFAKAQGLQLMTNFNLNKHYTTYHYRKVGAGARN